VLKEQREQQDNRKMALCHSIRQLNNRAHYMKNKENSMIIEKWRYVIASGALYVQANKQQGSQL
jgi:hypothetical protein